MTHKNTILNIRKSIKKVDCPYLSGNLFNQNQGCYLQPFMLPPRMIKCEISVYLRNHFQVFYIKNIDYSAKDSQGKLLYHSSNFYREGKNSILWDGFDKEGKLLPAGIYLLRLQGENFQEAKKLVIERYIFRANFNHELRPI
jgi:hypothetical protein